jgi:hypothetical protein
MKKVKVFIPDILNNGYYLFIQMTRVAVERSAEKRLKYVARIGMYQASQLVFVDESSVDRQTTYHSHAWSIRGTKAQWKAFFIHGRRCVYKLFCIHH